MSLFTRGETNGVRPTHPEGKVHDCTGSEVADHWGDLSTEHQAMRVFFLNIQNLVLYLKEPKTSEWSFISFPVSRLHWVFISLCSCMQSLQFSVQADFNAEICFPCHIIVGSTNSLTLALDSLDVVVQVRQC